MKQLKKINAFLLIICLVLTNWTSSSYCFIGWYREGDKMTYLNENGYKLATTWKESDGKMFYLDDNGYVVYNKAFEYNGNIYYVDETGARVTNQFVDITADMIIGTNIEPGTFYFSDKGTAYRRTDTKFIKDIGGKKYAFDRDYHLMSNCWLDEDGEIIDDAESFLQYGLYYVNEDGSIKQNEWYNFLDDIGSTEDMGESGLISTDYDEMSGIWLYFKNDGKKAKAGENDEKLEKLKINGVDYSFDEQGVLLLGFEKNRGVVDWTQKSNPVVSDKIVVRDIKDGYVVKNRWIYQTTPEDFDLAEHNDAREYWFYADEDGELVKNKVKRINNKKYVFDGFGRLKKGFVLIDGKSFYVAEYKSEDLSKDDFIYSVIEGGRLYGSDLSDLHYFDEDDSNEGVMVTGAIQIELSDGTYEFNFKSSGRAYGNHNELKLYKDCYYKNGLKFVPFEETKYGIVKVSNDEYRVIGSNGKMIKGKRKLIKDDYGNYMIIYNDRLVAYLLETTRKTQLRWKTFNGVRGYYYYDMDLEHHDYTGIAVDDTVSYPTDAMLSNIPKDMRVNFR